MDPIKISHHLKISSMEEMNDFSVKLGWDALNGDGTAHHFH